MINGIQISYGVQENVRKLFALCKGINYGNLLQQEEDAIPPPEDGKFWVGYRNNFVKKPKNALKKTTYDVDGWPSIALLTFLHTYEGLTSLTTSQEDASTVVAGFEDSRIRIWSAKDVSHKNKQNTTSVEESGLNLAIEENEEEEEEDGAADNSEFGRKSDLLIGHSGPVYGVSLWKKTKLLSCSYDGSIRYWEKKQSKAKN
jgi:WD40 repeat protein